MRILRTFGIICLVAAPVYGQATPSCTINGVPCDGGYITQTQLQSQVQAATATTQADGTFSGTWPMPFPQQPTSYVAGIPSTSNTPLICSIQYADVNGFTGKCWQLSATTLPSTTTALLGLVVSPVSNAASGQTVRIFGKQ